MKIAQKITIFGGYSILLKNHHGLLKRAQLAKKSLIRSPCQLVTNDRHILAGGVGYPPSIDFHFLFWHNDFKSSDH